MKLTYLLSLTVLLVSNVADATPLKLKCLAASYGGIFWHEYIIADATAPSGELLYAQKSFMNQVPESYSPLQYTGNSSGRCEDCKTIEIPVGSGTDELLDIKLEMMEELSANSWRAVMYFHSATNGWFPTTTAGKCERIL